MTDPTRLAAEKIIVSIGHASFYMKPNMLAMVILRGIGGFRYGLAPDHAFAVASYGILLAAGLCDFKGSIAFGQVGLKLIDKMGAREQECRTIFVYNAIVRHWSFPIRDTIDALRDGYRIGMETGDIGFASFNLFLSDVHALFSCMELSELDGIMSRNNQTILGLNQNYTMTLHSLTWQAVFNLRGQCDDPLKVSGKAIDGETLLPAWESANNRAALAVFWFVKLIMGTVYNDFALAVKASDKYKRYSASMLGIVINLYAVLCDSMARLFIYKDLSLREKMKYRATIMMNQLKMKKWSASSPTNGLHMYYLVEALRVWLIHGNIKKAETLFEQAVRLCKKHHDIIIEGIASEHAINFFQAAGNEKKANAYKAAAYSCYSRWGAAGLLNKLNGMYPDIVTSAGKTSQDTMVDATVTTSSHTLAATLDLSSAMKVSEAITSEIMLERLLQKIMHMSLTNAGAQSGYLILDTDGELTIEVSEDADKKESLAMQSMALKDCNDICHAIVNYVHHSGKDIVLGHALYEGPFTDDPYIMNKKCKSILCFPFMHKGHLAGILYMENNLSTNAFTPERLNILRMFSAQAAISIENARLFEQATTDGMTKLYVHRYFQLLLDKEIKRSSRHNRKFSVIMMDIDNFKSFNDTYGHLEGNYMLSKLGQVVKRCLRGIDTAYRYGGEEFTIILPMTSAEEGIITAKRIQTELKKEAFSPSSGQKVYMTVSIGIAQYKPKEDFKMFIRRADQLMYKGKKNGRDKICSDDGSVL
jgi:diguanylate cyclase (GGDEF)-like protein